MQDKTFQKSDIIVWSALRKYGKLRYGIAFDYHDE